MLELREVRELVENLVAEMEPSLVNEALGAIASQGGTLEDAKFFTGQRYGVHFLANTLYMRLQSLGEGK